ncbi:hypothetical protein SCP_0304660 [Sparassis crispa]|uniref:Terpene synthase n=1 Tax=Sparassis crispa TaxID=139825 RepID=A0A401GEZ0_9APHY|nr:hypothetical protein SCP_0304660 [Sparassis crispa]GBE80747.1 hypothetical protein SCP_0304660 [Sparassis crispa]
MLNLGQILDKFFIQVSLLLSKPHSVRPSIATLSKEDLLLEFKGSRVLIPDLYALLPGWRFNVNKHCDSVRKQLNEWMLSWVDDEKNRRRMQAADFALLAGCFYPDAEEEEYLMMAYYHLWVFVWDDELDCGPLTHDYEGAQIFRKETDDCLHYTLGPEPFKEPRPPIGPIMAPFCEVAEKVVAGSTPDARAEVLRELEGYVEGACALPGERQGEKDQKAFLSMEKFMAQRARSGGAGPSITLLLYIYHIDLPTLILEHDTLQTIFHQACLIVHLVNDIVSFVKEIRDDQLDNIVPVLAIEHSITLQEAIERACDLVRAARHSLEMAETHLPVTGSTELDGQIARYVQGCKDVAAGNLHWSYQNARYFGQNPQREGNKIFLQI